MSPQDFILVLIIVVIIGLAGLYVYRAKKKGQKCIGCPDSGTCGKKGSPCGSGNCGGCSCCCGDNNK